MAAFVAALGAKTGGLVCTIAFLFHNIIFIPAVFLIADSGLKLFRGIHKRCINLKEEIIRHFVIMLISIMLILISSLVEVYFSMNLLIFFKEIL